MKIGVFDSGLGGLFIVKMLRRALPEYDYIYLGDTLNIPYGKRSTEAIYCYTEKAVDYLFKQQDCHLIIIACNTASAAALRKLQRHYLVKNFPDRRILGVVVPVLEEASVQQYKRIGLIGTHYTVSSNIYHEELQKIDSDIALFQQATPLLVPLIEEDGEQWIASILDQYLSAMLSEDIRALILGCTHYAYLKPYLNNVLGLGVDILSQDDIIPEKFINYLRRHPEHESLLSRNGSIEYLVTDLTDSFRETACKIIGDTILLEKIDV